MGHATTKVSGELARLIGRESSRVRRFGARARDGDVVGVHQTRVATRRLREMLAVAAVLPKADVRGLRRMLRRLAGALGAVRELDVAHAVWHEPRDGAAWPPAVARSLDRAAEVDRERHAASMQKALDRYATDQLSRRLGAVADALRDDEHYEAVLVAALASRLRRRGRELDAALDAVGTAYVPVPLHDARLAAKKLRYVGELLVSLARVPVKAEVGRLKAAQDLLGRIHDLQVVQERMQTLAADVRDRRTVRALERAGADLEVECRERHAKFVAAVPSLVQVSDRLLGTAIALIQPRAGRIPGLDRDARQAGSLERERRGS